MLEKLGLYSKKYLFAGILIIVGIVLVIMALTPETTIDKTQTSRFLVGGLCILIAGVVTLLYVLEVISKYIHLAVMAALFVTCAILTVFSIQSLEETMDLQAKDRAYQANGQQGLEDIRTIQLAYKKVYGTYATSFPELKRFLMQDEVYRTIPTVLHPSGIIPDRQPNPEECLILGYDLIEDEALIQDGIDEEEAIKLGYFTVDTIWVPVLEDLFTGEDAMNSEIERIYPFDPSKLDVIRTPDDSEATFIMESAVLDSANNAFMVTDTVMYDPFRKKEFLSLGNLIDGGTTASWEQ